MNTILSILLSSQLLFTYYFYAAKQALERQEYDKALMTLRFCEELNPEDGTTQEYLGLIYDALGDTQKAERYFSRAYELDPYDLWKQYALHLSNSKDDADKKKILSILRRAAADHPKEEEPWQMLLKAEMMMGEYKRALVVQDHLDSIVGYDMYSAYTRYTIHRAMDKPKLAIADIERYLALDPREVNLQVLRVQMLEWMGAKWQVLEEGYQTVLALDPSNTLILNNYAYGLAIHGGDLKQAERMSQQTVREEPDNPIYLDTYAWILHLQGQDSLAAMYIRRAMEHLGNRNDKELKKHYKAIVKGEK